MKIIQVESAHQIFKREIIISKEFAPSFNQNARVVLGQLSAAQAKMSL